MQGPPRPRLAALDSFRGLTVAGMIIVNTPGSGEHVWWPLDHAEWHGFTPTDLVFPAFLCAMGVALGLSFPRAINAQLWRRVAWRVFALIAIGWAWQMLAQAEHREFPVASACCPASASASGSPRASRSSPRAARPDGKARLNPTAILIAIIVLLLGYWAAMALGGDFTPEGNLAGAVDRAVLGANHMWRAGTDAAGNVVYDPEGLLSTLPATANVLFGLLAALAWQRARDPRLVAPDLVDRAGRTRARSARPRARTLVSDQQEALDEQLRAAHDGPVRPALRRLYRRDAECGGPPPASCPSICSG